MTDVNIDGIVTWLSNWFQDKLVSGTNIKTVNNQSLLGSGNINISGGGGSSNLFDLNTISQYEDNAVEEGADRDGTGLGYGNDILIYNSQEAKFYYDKNSNADYDTGNELATMNDLPTNSSIVDLIYPVGSIYMSTANVDPATLFGGTWERIQDKFLLAKGSTYSTLNGTGGSANAVVVSHNHTQNAHSHEPSNTALKFLTSEGDMSVNTTKRAFPSSSSNGHHFVYTDLDNNGINEYDTTSSVAPTINSTGVSGTGKNMPPYIVVNVWKRTG